MKILEVTTTALSLAFLLGTSRTIVAEDAPELCGTCWCIDGSSGASCPAFKPGHYDQFAPELSEVLKSLVPAGSGMEGFQLQAANGSTECNPFYHLEPNEKMPGGDLPPCVPPPAADFVDPSCTVRFADGAGDGGCCGRTYELVDAVGDDTADGVLTHTGHCGVCSTMQDLAVIGSKVAASGRSLDTQSIACTSIFVVNTGTLGKDLNTEFNTLVSCFAEEVGYSAECAKLWAYSSAATSALCLESCSGLGGSYNGPPPECELSQCIKCSETVQQEQFQMFAGRSYVNSGITQPIARACDSFSAVEHEAICGADGVPDTCSGDGGGGGGGGDDGGSEPPPTPPGDDATSVASMNSNDRTKTAVLLVITGVVGFLDVV